MNFTFYSAVNDLPTNFNNNAFWFLLPIGIILCFIVCLSTKDKKNTFSNVLLSGLYTIAFWLFIGVILYYFNDSNFISDWINSAVAIGTIGAVFTSLYISKQSKYENGNQELSNEIKKTCYLGMEILDAISRYDFIIKDKFSGNDFADIELSKNLTKYQLDLILLFDKESQEFETLLNTVVKAHDNAIKMAIEQAKLLAGTDAKHKKDLVIIYNEHIKGNQEIENSFYQMIHDAFNNEHSFRHNKLHLADVTKRIIAKTKFN